LGSGTKTAQQRMSLQTLGMFKKLLRMLRGIVL